MASLGVHVHGGMGFIEETGAAQHYRDARIAPIYEGTNGIQAADLVGRKIGLEGGAVLARLLDDIAADTAGHGPLSELVGHCRNAADALVRMSDDERMTASYPFLTLLSVTVCGWLMGVQLKAAEAAGSKDSRFLEMKRAAAGYYLDQIVPEASGLVAAITRPANVYQVSDEALVA